MSEKWYRVSAPSNPLHGCDVRGAASRIVLVDGEPTWLPIDSLRRVDVFMGDRPFQVNGIAADLGIMVRLDQLVDSPIQDEIVELATDRPFGICIDESEMTRKDGLTMRMVRYETGTQVALDDASGLAIGSWMIRGFRDLLNPKEEKVIGLFEQGVEDDDLAWTLNTMSTEVGEG